MFLARAAPVVNYGSWLEGKVRNVTWYRSNLYIAKAIMVVNSIIFKKINMCNSEALTGIHDI